MGVRTMRVLFVRRSRVPSFLGRQCWVSHAESVGRVTPVQADPHGERHAHGVFFPDHVAEDHLGKLPRRPMRRSRRQRPRDDQADDAQSYASV